MNHMKKLITIFTLAAVAGCCYVRHNDCGSPKCITGRFIDSVSMFDNINHTAGEEFPRLVNDPIDLDPECERCIDSLGTDFGVAMGIRETCNRMKAYVHQKGMALRAVAPKETVEALDRFEASFDTLFHRCISQEYYLRLFHDCFNETIPQALDSLVASCRKFALNDECLKEKQ